MIYQVNNLCNKKHDRRPVLTLSIKFARDHKYAWYSTGLFANLTDNVHLLLKEGLKIGYSPPTQYSRK